MNLAFLLQLLELSLDCSPRIVGFGVVVRRLELTQRPFEVRDGPLENVGHRLFVPKGLHEQRERLGFCWLGPRRGDL